MKRQLLTVLVWLAVLLTAGAWTGETMNTMTAGQAREELAQVEQAVRRAAVTCFAAEGAYPPDTAYLTEHYGLRVDTERYIVDYDVFAENLMPQITVVRKDG